MHAAAVRHSALALSAQGVSDCEISRRLGVPRTTIRDWRRPPRPRTQVTGVCLRCWGACRPVLFEASDYAEMLGLYLGDGHICRLGRTQRLRIHLDARYARDVDETEALLRRCFPANRVSRGSRYEGSMVILSVYHGHLGCLFPQRGAGKKHLRSVKLESWQSVLVASAPWNFLRGCIRSDGCVFVNRTGRYEYLSYEFSNLSPDIVDVFMTTAESLGLHPRRYRRYVRLCRRDDVARLLEKVGTKS